MIVKPSHDIYHETVPGAGMEGEGGGGGTRFESCCFITHKVLQIMWVLYLTASLDFRENTVIAFGTHVRASL